MIDARLDRVIPSPSIPAAVPSRTAEHTGVIGSDRIERLLRSPALMTSIVLLGAALRVWAYASNTSLYLDEILLTRNILDLPVSHLLTQPLLLDQVSPRGFLLVERLAVMIFGQGELIPYEVDVAAAIGLLLLALDVQEREASTKCLLLWGIVGFVVVWFSQASVLMMAGLGFGLALDWLISRDRRTTRALAHNNPAVGSKLGRRATRGTSEHDSRHPPVHA